MSFPEKIIELRKRHGYTQDDLAVKLFVTRQAVSRWENGLSMPSIDTLKDISTIFDEKISTLLELDETSICQSCSMPLATLDDLGTNSDESPSLEYCQHCYLNGSFTHDRSLDEMVEVNLKFLDDFNRENKTSFSEDEARTVLKLHLASLKRWKKTS